MKAILILGGSIQKDDSGRWRTTTFSEGDSYCALGDNLRVIAGSYLFDEDHEQEIITFGGLGQLRDVEGVPFIGDVMRDELIERGVRDDHVIAETESNNTYEQLQQVKRLVEERSYGEVVIVTNEYHVPRVRAMIEKDSALSELERSGVLSIATAEKIVIEHEPKSEKSIRDAYASEAMKERMLREAEGVEQIKRGTYKYR